jgi:D-proline reductase (dithiol) PrdB
MQSVGLIQRVIEKEGIPTISISLNRTITEKVNPPRSLLVAFPLGHPMGNPFDKEAQKRLLADGLKYVQTVEEPGTIVDLTSTYKIEGGKCTVCEVEAWSPQWSRIKAAETLWSSCPPSIE